MNALGTDQYRLAVFTGRHQITRQHSNAIECCIGLRNHVLAFFNGRQVVNLRGDLAVHHTAVRRLNETVLVQTGIQRQRVDQANVGAFGRFNRANPAVMGHVYVTHFKAGTFARQATGAKG